MPLDEAGNAYQPVLALPSGLTANEEVFCIRYTGELFVEYQCAPLTRNRIVYAAHVETNFTIRLDFMARCVWAWRPAWGTATTGRVQLLNQC